MLETLILSFIGINIPNNIKEHIQEQKNIVLEQQYKKELKEKTEGELLCKEFLYNNPKMYKKFNCKKYNLQPKHYLNIKN